MVFVVQLLVDDAGDQLPVSAPQTCPNSWIADSFASELLFDFAKKLADGLIIDKLAGSVIVELGITIDDSDAVAAPGDSGRAEISELAAVAFGGDQVCSVGFGEFFLDGAGDPCIHCAEAVAAMDDNIKAPV